jgi:hypothetical protein
MATKRETWICEVRGCRDVHETAEGADAHTADDRDSIAHSEKFGALEAAYKRAAQQLSWRWSGNRWPGERAKVEDIIARMMALCSEAFEDAQPPPAPADTGACTTTSPPSAR